MENRSSVLPANRVDEGGRSEGEVWSISATLKQDRPGRGKFLIGTGEGDKGNHLHQQSDRRKRRSSKTHNKEKIRKKKQYGREDFSWVQITIRPNQWRSSFLAPGRVTTKATPKANYNNHLFTVSSGLADKL